MSKTSCFTLLWSVMKISLLRQPGQRSESPKRRVRAEAGIKLLTVPNTELGGEPPGSASAKAGSGPLRQLAGCKLLRPASCKLVSRAEAMGPLGARPSSKLLRLSGAEPISDPPRLSSTESASSAKASEELLMASSADLDGAEAGSELPRSTRAEASCAPPRPTSPGSGCNGLSSPVTGCELPRRLGADATEKHGRVLVAVVRSVVGLPS